MPVRTLGRRSNYPSLIIVGQFAIVYIEFLDDLLSSRDLHRLKDLNSLPHR